MNIRVNQKAKDRINQIYGELNDEGKKWITAVDEDIQALAGQVCQDQAEWIDACLKKILPPDLYEAGRKLERSEDITAYCEKHGIAIVHIPDTFRWEIRVRGKIVAEFKPVVTANGEPLEYKKQPGGLLDSAQDGLTSN